MKTRGFLVLLLLAMVLAGPAVQASPQRPVADSTMAVDGEGVLRWRDTGDEVALFGVNYYAPHVFDFSNLKLLGLPIHDVIDQDLAHFSRMGLDALRLHVFDREITDEAGNLIENDHLELLDYLVARAKERGIYVVLTPIAWWPGVTPNSGFSNRYDMPEMILDPAAREAQRRYLDQFMRHVNAHTGLAFKDEPAVPVFELINEPQYAAGTTDEQVVAYVNALVDAIRATGCTKPLFYNGWSGRHAAVRDAKVQGCTFGWYPSGLVAGRQQTDNYLPRIDDYPDMRSPELAHKAKIVYEFDAADIGGSYMYPAMARAFRSGGAQIATQFQYDPLPLAPSNVGWQTHYLNLVYTPRKAVSFIIAGEAFRRLPRHKLYGAYPENTRFSNDGAQFRVSFEEDLSELVGERVFMYSNTTGTEPPAAQRLERIAGCGSSPVVQYNGTGAYFLDKLSEGVWRLEVYPDAVWVNDPFGKVRLDREVSRVVWRTRHMTLALPGLGSAFYAQAANGSTAVRAEDGRFAVTPGVYLLSRKTLERDEKPTIDADAFIAPPQTRHDVAVWHTPPATWVEKATLPIAATVVGLEEPRGVSLLFRKGSAGTFEEVAMSPFEPYRYKAELPGDMVQPGTVSYAIAVDVAQTRRVFPLDAPRETFSSPPAPYVLYAPDGAVPPPITFTGPASEQAQAEFVPGNVSRKRALRLLATGFGKDDGVAAVRLPIVKSDVGDLSEEASLDQDVLISARTLYPQTVVVELGLVGRDAAAHGADITLTMGWRDIRVPLTDLRPLWGTQTPHVRPDDLSEISLVFGTWLYGDDSHLPHGFEIERIALAPRKRTWGVEVVAQNAPIVLLDAEDDPVHVQGQVFYRQRLVPGMTPDALAVRIGVRGFRPPPSALSFKHDVSAGLAPRREHLSRCNVLRVRARAKEATTSAVELVLSERDGAPWGTNVPLTVEWREVTVPLSELRLFTHWGGVPANRGGEGDRFHPEDAALLTICFGAWLYPDDYDTPHTIEIERAWLDVADLSAD